MADNNLPSHSPKSRSGWNLAFGIWLIIAPFILGYAAVTPAFRNDIYVGIIVFILALIGTLSTDIRWSRTLNVIAGIWLLFAPFILRYPTAAAMSAIVNDVILGILVIVFASTSLSLANKFHGAHMAHGQ
jgi:SPW repeat